VQASNAGVTPVGSLERYDAFSLNSIAELSDSELAQRGPHTRMVNASGSAKSVVLVGVVLVPAGSGIASKSGALLQAGAAATAAPEDVPTAFAVQGNYPNPFNPSTRIVLDLPEAAAVTVRLYDVLGRAVLALPVQALEAGRQRTVEVDGASLASGTYFYVVRAVMATGSQERTGKMLLLR
jgi:hypothetical protein